MFLIIIYSRINMAGVADDLPKLEDDKVRGMSEDDIKKIGRKGMKKNKNKRQLGRKISIRKRGSSSKDSQKSSSELISGVPPDDEFERLMGVDKPKLDDGSAKPIPIPSPSMSPKDKSPKTKDLLKDGLEQGLKEDLIALMDGNGGKRRKRRSKRKRGSKKNRVVLKKKKSRK